MRNFVWIACLIYGLNGFGHIIIGTVLEPMVHAYGIDYGAGGQLIMNQFLGFLIGVIFAPAIMKKLGHRTTVLLALASFCTAQFVFSSLLDWYILLTVAPLSGAAIGILEAVVAVVIIGHFKEKKARALVMAEIFFGVGALLIPAVSALLISFGVWNVSFLIVAVTAGLSALLWLFLPFGELEPILKKQPQALTEDGKKAPRKRYGPKQLPVIIAGACFFFIYVGTEMVIPNYLPTILGMTTELGESSLALSITVFWLAITIGRMCMTFIIDRIGYHKLFMICCIGQFLCLTLFAFSTTAAVIFGAIFLTGLFMGAIFSLALLIINETNASLVDWTTSLLVAMGGLGGAILPKIAGELIDHYTIDVTLWSIVLFGFIVMLVMAAIFYLRKRVPRSELL